MYKLEDDRRAAQDAHDFVPAFRAAWNSPDPDTKVGAAVYLLRGHVSDVIAGYNAPAAGVRRTPERLARPLKYTYTMHAEVRLLMDLLCRGGLTKEHFMFLTWQPCAQCASAISMAGVNRLRILVKDDDAARAEQYGFNAAQEILEESGVEVRAYREAAVRAALGKQIALPPPPAPTGRTPSRPVIQDLPRPSQLRPQDLLAMTAALPPFRF